MILIQNSLGACKVGLVLCGFVPRQVKAGVKVVPYNISFLRCGRCSCQPVRLFKQLFGYLGSKLQSVYLLHIFVGFVLNGLVLAQLLGDSPHLFPQVIFLLGLVYL